MKSSTETLLWILLMAVSIYVAVEMLAWIRKQQEISDLQISLLKTDLGEGGADGR